MPNTAHLYQEAILDHSSRPRNFRRPEGEFQEAEGYNPLCGDHVRVYVVMDGECIRDVAFEGTGCAISKASASLMTGAVQGKSRSEAEELFRAFHSMLTTEGANERTKLGKLVVFAGVSEYPSRVKCATLAWHALHEALRGSRHLVSTE